MIRKLIRAFNKIIVQALKYKIGSDYKSEKYWEDRFKKYNLSYQGIGHDGLTHTNNKKLYNDAGQKIFNTLDQFILNCKKHKILEIGPGLGYYTNLLNQYGVKNYVGIDITAYYFNYLKEAFPNYQFIKKDVSTTEIEKVFDVIIMIDVIQHIVTYDKFIFTLQNIDNALSKNGIILISGFHYKKKLNFLFYEKKWTKAEILNQLHGYIILKETPFRLNNLLVLQKNESK